MKNPTGKNIEKLVFGMFDQMVEGADKYVTKQESTWLIFTEDKRWVIEFTNDKTLWFNYNIFQSELDLIGKDCTEERDLIKRWFESRFLNVPKVEETLSTAGKPLMVEDTIQNGVRHTSYPIRTQTSKVEDTIQNGVKNTSFYYDGYNQYVEDTIENGVKDTFLAHENRVGIVEYTIENGVKDIIDPFWVDPVRIKDAIQNGVKEVRTPGVGDLESTMDFMNENNTLDVQKLLDDVIENGVKEVMTDDGMIRRLGRQIRAINTIKNGVKHVEDGDWLDQDERIDDIIENGVKELKELPDKSGEFRGYGDYYHRQEDITKPHTEYVKEVIEDSYNHMGRVEGIIRNTDKGGIR